MPRLDCPPPHRRLKTNHSAQSAPRATTDSHSLTLFRPNVTSNKALIFSTTHVLLYAIFVLFPVGNQLLFGDVSLHITSGVIKRRLSSRSLASAILHYPNFSPAGVFFCSHILSFGVTRQTRGSWLIPNPECASCWAAFSVEVVEIRAAISKNELQKMGPLSLLLRKNRRIRKSNITPKGSLNNACVFEHGFI